MSKRNYVISQDERSTEYAKRRRTSNAERVMFCWGNTVNGELGLGGIEEDRVLVPRELSFSKSAEVADVACGQNHTVMLSRSGELYSCGSNDYGQLGRGKACRKLEKVDGLNAYRIASASCGAQHSVVVSERGQVFSWGSNSHGQLGNGRAFDGNPQKIPKLLTRFTAIPVVQVSCGERHCLALTKGGELYSWGANEYGQLGLGTSTFCEPLPHVIQSLRGLPIANVACGNNHSFVVSTSGAVYGWGRNESGQLGQNNTNNKLHPRQLKVLRSFGVKYIACGEDFSVFLTKDGGVYTCGAGMFGQLGHGAMANEFVPKKVLELMGSAVTQVSCGRRHTLVFVPSEGLVYAFGLGAAGQLGNKATINVSTPQVVLGPWVSPERASIRNLDEATLPSNMVVKSIFAGGDHCFTSVAHQEANVSPNDFRVLKAANQILCFSVEKGYEIQTHPPTGPINTDLLMYIEIGFSKLACINSSFLLGNDEHYCCNSRNSGIDFAAAEEFFTCISRAELCTVHHMIMLCVHGTLLPSLALSPPDAETLRVYMSLMYYHEFDNPKNHMILHNPFAQSILDLKMEAGKILDKWWIAAPVDFFERMIRCFKNVVVYVITKADGANPAFTNWDERIIVSLQMLYRLHMVNRGIEGLKVPSETFYIPELLEKVDLKSDYARWLMLQDPRLLPGLPRLKQKIYFCDFAFLFDVRAKTIILQVDQALQMHLAMTEAAHQAAAAAVAAAAAAADRRAQRVVVDTIEIMNSFFYFEVTRERIVEDTLHVIGQCDPKDLKRPLKVKFKGEEAEDAGGVRKEFFLLLIKEVLDPKYGMFQEDEETRNIWFNIASFEENEMYHLIGVMCGLAIYNFIIVDLPFPLALYKKLLNQRVGLQDLEELSPTIARNLQHLLDYEDPDVEEQFLLTFEMSKEVFGEVKVLPLKPGGQSLSVTQSNKKEYVDLYVDMVLNKSIEKQFEYFCSGFKKVCGGRIVDLFQPHELMEVIVGNEDYDWDILERNTEYRNGYTASDPTIKLFWKVFHELSLEEKKKFLLFLTGSDRIPIQGMQAIEMYIQPAGDDTCLPVAHTCFNLLDLPHYSTIEKMRLKLLQAIEQTHGFSLV